MKKEKLDLELKDVSIIINWLLFSLFSRGFKHTDNLTKQAPHGTELTGKNSDKIVITETDSDFVVTAHVCNKKKSFKISKEIEKKFFTHYQYQNLEYNCARHNKEEKQRDKSFKKISLPEYKRSLMVSNVLHPLNDKIIKFVISTQETYQKNLLKNWKVGKKQPKKLLDDMITEYGDTCHKSFKKKKGSLVFVHRFGNHDEVSIGGDLLCRATLDEVKGGAMVLKTPMPLEKDDMVWIGFTGSKELGTFYVHECKNGYAYLGFMNVV